MKTSYWIAAVLAAVSGPALAGGLADPIVPLPPVLLPPEDPNEFYGGLQIGIVSGSFLPDPADTFFGETDFEGPLYGLHFGAQRSFGSFELGVEVAYNTTVDDLEDSGTDTVVEMDHLAHLKLRAGTYAGPVLLYGTVGLAFVDMMIDPSGPIYDNINVSQTAPVYGIGLDTAINNNLSVGIEFLRHSFDVDAVDGGETTLGGSPALDIAFDTLVVRASFHF